MWCVKCHYFSPRWSMSSHPSKCPQCSKDLELTNVNPYIEAQKLRAKNRKQKVDPEEMDKRNNKKEDVSFVFQKKNLQRTLVPEN